MRGYGQGSHQCWDAWRMGLGLGVRKPDGVGMAEKTERDRITNSTGGWCEDKTTSRAQATNQITNVTI